MITLYTVKVSIPAGALKLERTFTFKTPESRVIFIGMKPKDVEVLAEGINHLMTYADALDEIERERNI